jgi:hypothetical protein
MYFCVQLTLSERQGKEIYQNIVHLPYLYVPLYQGSLISGFLLYQGLKYIVKAHSRIAKARKVQD